MKCLNPNGICKINNIENSTCNYLFYHKEAVVKLSPFKPDFVKETAESQDIILCHLLKNQR